ncbi:MAG: hypothetical protein JOS17DRAFT_830649 [Linnemannia elongata]|nr:MAG: hypothetical protein JOS17DRAFT_830649 [Linnemannia elongata]
MDTNPLSLSEIVLTIGRFIPLWEPVGSAGKDLWFFTPTDLLAAISVNRLLHAILQPLLWSVHVASALKSLGDPKKFIGPNSWDIPFDIVKKNCPYVHVLDLSNYWKQVHRVHELNCSRLQELCLSGTVNCAWAKRTILANPELRVFHWTRTNKNLSPEMLTDFECILSLRQLRYLGLGTWSFLTPHLYRVLANNADHLEDLSLTNCDSLVRKRSEQDVTGTSHETFVTSMGTGVEELEAMKRMCGRLRLEKLKRLHLDVEFCFCEQTLFWLNDVVPALETVVFGVLLGSFADAPGQSRDLELTIHEDDYQDSFSNLGTILERCSRLKHLKLYFYWHMERCDRRAPLLFLNKLATCPGLESFGFHGFILKYDGNLMHESDDDDYGSDEGTMRARTVKKQKFDYYNPDANIFLGPSWRELYVDFGSDERKSECCTHFKRLVGDAIGSLSSLKRVVFGSTTIVNVLSSSS